jgi:TFIIF-interacting CTD phosphatase-like protein
VAELQVDTAGTRAYAQRVVSLLDPTGRLFGGRVVSRCDSTLRHKQQTAWLHRTLADDSMVLIGESSSSSDACSVL